jgi:hypothetical protein
MHIRSKGVDMQTDKAQIACETRLTIRGRPTPGFSRPEKIKS